MLPRETNYFNDENNSASLINGSRTEQKLNINNKNIIDSKNLNEMEGKQRCELKFSINTQKEPSIDQLLSSDQAYSRNQTELEKPNFICLMPEPSSISSISKEMRRLCSILTFLFDSKNSGYLEFTEEQYRWHWINILKCTTIEEFSPYQVILAPFETNNLNLIATEKVISDLNAFYKLKLHEKENKALKSVSKRGCKKENDAVTSVKFDQVLANINDSINLGELNKTKDEIYKSSTRSPCDSSSKKKLSKPGRKSISKENAARILRMCLASGVSEASKTKNSIKENNSDELSNKISDRRESSDLDNNKELESDNFQMNT
ncbi:hypothetical protein CmeUKMEL1_04645 [Cryptosporidium meleagridis]|uniref:Uncharacterized protein n=1 Tax=Cryptosporidium meleagridis TaxID=93969 RepID=A0A2P4YYJ8_9CRYT|nr:hypothetical protein CmeUKMEL1_04645 [Cryptosporidium meleagridis]